MTLPTSALLEELEATNERFERSTPLEILSWTFEQFGDDVAMACSFEDLALLHMVHEQRPGTENLTRTKPGPDADAWPCGTERCCELRKVEPLKRAVSQRAAWITSVKRADGPTRAGMKTLLWDEKFGLVKVNPLATWSDEDVSYYIGANGLPEHPLWAQGYGSIGCAAVTMKPQVPGDRRSGRWVGADKEECGLHEA